MKDNLEKDMIKGLRTNTVHLLCNRIFIQNYHDAKCRIGKHKCPDCQDRDEEFDGDSTVFFDAFKNVEVFKPNRYVEYKEDPVLYFEEAKLYKICLCKAQVYCKKCGNIIPIYSYERYIDQMHDIIEHLKEKDIEISMPRPPEDDRYLITYFKVLDFNASREYEEREEEEDFEQGEDTEEDEDKPRLKYTEECVQKSTIIPGTGKSFLNRDLSLTYTSKY